ncbi:hypothetical protein K438DRAFT_1785705 [Mycena galopus ATCC 62051]|nr:hypothetical protein K438DRAFT_1785705 [Mycena galopus ATCC 62051]
MCAHDYKNRNPDAGKADFETYFTGLPSDKKKFWREEEKKAKTAKAAASTIPTSGASSAGVGLAKLGMGSVNVDGDEGVEQGGEPKLQGGRWTGSGWTGSGWAR